MGEPTTSPRLPSGIPSRSVEQELERARLTLDRTTTLGDALTTVYAALTAVRNGPGQLDIGYGPDRPVTVHAVPLWLLVAACDVLEAVAAGHPVARGGRHGSPARRIHDRERDLLRYRLMKERLQAGDSKNAARLFAAGLLNETPRTVEQAYERVRKNPTRYADGGRGPEVFLQPRASKKRT